MNICFGGPPLNPCRTFAKSTYFLTELEPEPRCPNDRPTYLHCLQIIPNCGPLWIHAVRAENRSDPLPTPHHSALGRQYDPRDCTPQPTISPSPDPYFHNKLEPSPTSIIPSSSLSVSLSPCPPTPVGVMLEPTAAWIVREATLRVRLVGEGGVRRWL